MYYIKDGVLFFIFSKGYNPGEMYTAEELEISDEELWQMGGEAKTLKAFEKRIYFSKGEIIRYLTKDKTFSANTSDFGMSNMDNEAGDIDKLDGQMLNKHVLKMINALNEKMNLKTVN